MHDQVLKEIQTLLQDGSADPVINKMFQALLQLSHRVEQLENALKQYQ